jgi:3-oxoacyl-(acyl-carrier-protein) synthase III
VSERFTVMPRIEAISAVHGEIVCTNEDLVRNAAYNWSPMSAAEVVEKTGIEQRLYSRKTLEELGLEAARSALAHAGYEPAELGGVLVATCTSTRLMPSVATWICGELGIVQTHAAYDIVAACAGLPYGLLDATRLMQDVKAPVLLVCVEKFSDKIGNVRPSRMIFGDGAAGVVLGVAPDDQPSDIEYLQTFASGPASEVNSIIWPNIEFDNNVTVYGPEVKALAGRYLLQMVDELRALPAPDGRAGNLLDAIDLIVPHQANKTMVTQLARKAGLDLDRVYFNIAKVGNASAASIPLAIHDAVRDGVLTEPSRIFAPGYGAGAVAGYAVLRVDPKVVVTA